MTLIAELRELHAKATPGEWVYDGCSLSDFGREFPCSMSMEWIPNGRPHTDDDTNQLVEADGALIAAMRNALPALLDEIDRLTGERDAANALSDRLLMEAQCHAGEARAHKATVHEAYQIASGATGERGNWNGAGPIRELADRAESAETRLADIIEQCAKVAEGHNAAGKPIAAQIRALAQAPKPAATGGHDAG